MNYHEGNFTVRLSTRLLTIDIPYRLGCCPAKWPTKREKEKTPSYGYGLCQKETGFIMYRFVHNLSSPISTTAEIREDLIITYVK